MGTAGRSAPLRRAGSLLGLLGLELGAVLALHWLGRFPGLRIRWDEPVSWVLSSPVQEVLGAVLRTVGLVMAYWLLASTVLYLLASLTRLPAAVRAVGWATLPLARRVADHAVAVTLATSMVGGSTLGVAGPALAAERGGGPGPPAGKPVAAALASGFPGQQDPPYVPKPAGGAPAAGSGTTSTTTTPPAQPAPPATPYVPHPADRAPFPLPAPEPAPKPAPEPPAAPNEPSTSTAAPTTTKAPTTTADSGNSQGPREPAPPSSDSRGGGGSGGSSGSGSGGGGKERANEEESYPVARGDNLWSIARAHLAKARSGGSGEPTNQEVAEYWVRVVEANQGQLRSGDPDLIYPKEWITLPPVD